MYYHVNKRNIMAFYYAFLVVNFLFLAVTPYR